MLKRCKTFLPHAEQPICYFPPKHPLMISTLVIVMVIRVIGSNMPFWGVYQTLGIQIKILRLLFNTNPPKRRLHNRPSKSNFGTFWGPTLLSIQDLGETCFLPCILLSCFAFHATYVSCNSHFRTHLKTGWLIATGSACVCSEYKQIYYQ